MVFLSASEDQEADFYDVLVENGLNSISFSLIVKLGLTFYLPDCPPLIAFLSDVFKRQSVFTDGLFLGM